MFKEPLKNYFRNRPGIRVDSFDLMAYFHVPVILSDAQELLNEGWLKKTSHPVYPQMYQVGE